MDDFQFKYGNKQEGLKHALLPLMLLIVVPIAIVQIFLTGLKDLTVTCLLFGIFVVAFGFLRGFYPKGTYSRLVFSMVEAAFLGLYIFEVTTNLKQRLIDLSVDFDYDLFVILLLIVPLFLALSALGEMVDERNAWKQSLGLPSKTKSLNPDSRFIDFDPRIGKIGDGMKLSLRAYVLFILVPFVALTSVSGILESLNFQNSEGLTNAFKQALDAITIFSIVIIILSFFRGFYPKGTLSRVVFGTIVVVVILQLLQAAFLDGGLERAFLDAGFEIDLDLILLVLIIYAAIGFVVVLAEVMDNRRKWEKSIGRKVKSRTQEEKPNLFTDFRLRYVLFVCGTKGGKRAFRGTIMWPTLLLVIIIGLVMTSIYNPSFGIDLSPYVSLSSMQGLFAVTAVFGIPVILAQFLRCSYPKGALSRLVFGLMAAAFVALWYYEFWGGFLDAIAGAITSGAEHFPMILTLIPLIIPLLLILAAVRALFYTIEFFLHRDGWAKERAKLVD